MRRRQRPAYPDHPARDGASCGTFGRVSTIGLLRPGTVPSPTSQRIRLCRTLCTCYKMWAAGQSTVRLNTKGFRCEMMILWVKAGGLVPLESGGKIRSFHIASALARTHEVTLFIYCAEES